MNELELSSDLSLKLHPWLVENIDLRIKDLEAQAQKSAFHSKIYYCAIAAISIATLTLTLFTKFPSKALSLITISSIITTPYLALTATKHQNKERFLNQFLTEEKAVFIQFQKIQNWSEIQISEFLLEHHLNPPTSTPNDFLLNGVARYLASSQTALKAKELAEQYLRAEGINDRGLRFAMRSMGWNILENQAVPAALEAAFILCILNSPYTSYFLSDVYEVIQKSFAERQFDRLYGPDDNYLVKRSDPKRTFSLEDLLKDLDPDILKKKVFDI